MKIFKKSYVGIQADNVNEHGIPLGFLVPYEDNAAGKKRMDTVDGWCGGWVDSNPLPWHQRPRSDKTVYVPVKRGIGNVIDNIPQRGFKISGWSVRNITDNKTARITDPRGFELEIYIPNLIELITTNKIDNGEIMDELIWARDGANNSLISVNSVAYEQALKEGKKLVVSPGDIVKDGRNNQYQYLGRYFIQYVGKTAKLKQFHGNLGLVEDPTGTEITYSVDRPMHVYKHHKLVVNYRQVDVTVMVGQMTVDAVIGSVPIVGITGLLTMEDLHMHNIDGTKWHNPRDPFDHDNYEPMVYSKGIRLSTTKFG